LLLYLPFAAGRGELDGDGAEVHHLEHVLGLAVHLEDVLFEGGDVGDVVVPPLTLLLLQLDGDPAHRGALQPFHQVGDKSANLKEKNNGIFKNKKPKNLTEYTRKDFRANTECEK